MSGPLLMQAVAAGVLLAELNARVSALQEERTALAVQVPVNALAAELHQLQAARQATASPASSLAPCPAGPRHPMSVRRAEACAAR